MRPLRSALLTLLLVCGPVVRAQEERVALRFDGVELATFLQWMVHQHGLNLVLPKDESKLHEAKVTVYFAAEVPASRVYAISVAILSVHGYALVPVPGEEATYKVVASSELGGEPLPFLAEGPLEPLTGPDRLVTHLLRLEHLPASEFARVLREARLVDKSRGVVVELEEAGALLVSEYASVVARIAELARTLDVPPPPRRVEAIPLANARPADLARKIEAFELTRDEEDSRRIRVLADEDTRTIVVEGTEEEISRIRQLVALFDVLPLAERRQSFLYRLRHVDTKTFQPILEELLRQNFPPAAEGELPRVTVTAIESQGTLVFAGTGPDLERVRLLLAELDRRRPQIQIETAVIQLSGTDTLQLGVELSTLDPVANEGSVRTFANTQFGLSALVDEAGQSLMGAGAPGGRLPLAGPGITSFLTKDVATDIPALLRAIEIRAETEILSSPRLVLEDHAQGTVKIVQEEPVTQAVALNTASTSVAFKEFVEAGTTLTVTPHIAPGAEVRLEFEQSIDAFQGVGQGGVPPARTSRSLKTSIRLVSGQTVILGGFSGRRDVEVTDQVPVLGDIPILGLVFRSSSQVTEVTRIYVLVRPVILDQAGQPTLGEIASGERARMLEESGRGAPWEAPPSEEP